MPHSRNGESTTSIELDDFAQAFGLDADEEDAPAESSRSGQERVPLITASTLRDQHDDSDRSSHQNVRPRGHRKSSILPFVVEKLQGSKLARYAERLAVEHEPGLSTAQMMV